MPQLLTVRWPLFARLEALLFFPVAMQLASEIAWVQTIVDRWVAPAVAPLGPRFGIPDQATYWVMIAIVVFVPYVGAMVVADRFLTVRKGYALLSIVMIGAWIWAASHLAQPIAALLPDRIVSAIAFPPSTIPVAAGLLALLLHLRALWVGVLDRGDVAAHLIAEREERAYRPRSAERGRRAQDVYYRETAAFRDWRPQRELDGLGGAPRESTAVKALSMLTWIAIVGGTAFAYFNWNNFTAPGPTDNAAPAVRVSAGPLVPVHGVLAAAPPVPPEVVPAAPAAMGQPIVTAAMPTVQRPTEMSANDRSSDVYVGSNEAVAERGTDGGFAFDAVVNGSHVRMLFDTGASVVVLRAEDAEQLGINVNRLIYSAQVKTANGTADVAPIIIKSMLVGNITLRDVVGCVAKRGTLQQNLLGQAFLTRLAGFDVENNLLVLRGR